MKIMETDGGVWVQNRRHAKRRNGGKRSYHARISKKWLKRFGRSWCETQKRGEVFVLAGDVYLVRRDDMPALRAAGIHVERCGGSESFSKMLMPWLYEEPAIYLEPRPMLSYAMTLARPHPSFVTTVVA